MDKSTIQTILIILTVIATGASAAWVIRGEIANNTAAISELRGALYAHVNGHDHKQVVSEAEKQ